MREVIVWLGPAPALENCVSVGAVDYPRDARAECRAFVEAIRKVFVREPESARLVIQAQQHEFGDSFEVACVYDRDDEWASAYAARVDGRAPKTWEEAGMLPPQKRSLAR